MVSSNCKMEMLQMKLFWHWGVPSSRAGLFKRWYAYHWWYKDGRLLVKVKQSRYRPGVAQRVLGS